MAWPEYDAYATKKDVHACDMLMTAHVLTNQLREMCKYGRKDASIPSTFSPNLSHISINMLIASRWKKHGTVLFQSHEKILTLGR